MQGEYCSADCLFFQIDTPVGGPDKNVGFDFSRPFQQLYLDAHIIFKLKHLATVNFAKSTGQSLKGILLVARWVTGSGTRN